MHFCFDLPLCLNSTCLDQVRMMIRALLKPSIIEIVYIEKKMISHRWEEESVCLLLDSGLYHSPCCKCRLCLWKKRVIGPLQTWTTYRMKKYPRIGFLSNSWLVTSDYDSEFPVNKYTAMLWIIYAGKIV